MIITGSRLAFGIVFFAVETSSETRILRQKIFSKTGSCREASKIKKNDLKSPKKSLTRMEVKVNFKVYDGAAKNERHNLTEPNQALQRMTTLVTDRAPSSTLRAKRVHR